MLCLFFAKEAPEWPIEAWSVYPETALESSQDAKEYIFKPLAAVVAVSDPNEKRIIKGCGFKKKFSDQIIAATPIEKEVETVIKAGPVADAPATKSPGDTAEPKEKSGSILE